VVDGGLATPGLRATLTQQPWRLVTPIFIHFGVLHLLFNMFMVSDLGNQVEARRGSWRMLALVLAIAIPSNVAQYLYSNPLFGGLSGVAYGLFGYIWMKSRFDPGSGFYLHQRDVTIMLLWFVLCMVGVIGHVANVVHGVGLAVGMVIGIAPTIWREWRG
jgi:GlpG protein